MSAPPVVATMIGDPCGIGPEVVIKALASGTVPGHTLLVGDAGVVRDAIALTKSSFSVRGVRSVDEARFAPGCLDVLDPGNLRAQDVTTGQVSAACGRAVSEWWKLTLGLAADGRVAAAVKAPTNAEAIQLAGGDPYSEGGKTYLFLISGPLHE